MKTRQQSGFTLIELVMVIVILGILAVIAVPQYIDLRNDARVAATQGVAGAAASASAINYAGCQIDSTNSAKCTTVAACADVADIVDGAEDFTFGGASLDACTVTHPDDNSVQATFKALAATYTGT